MIASVDTAPKRARLDRVIAASVVLVGVAMRVLIMHGDAGVIDGDEAVVGIAALDTWAGDPRAFFPGQDFGGALETWLTAPFVGLGGSSRLTLKLVPLLLAGLGLLVVWRAGSQMVGDRAARLAALLCWVWPATFVWWSTKARGFYWVAFLASWLAVSLAVRLGNESPEPGARRRQRSAAWLAFGLAVGVAWWSTPLSLSVLVPTLVWLAWRRWRDARGVALAILGAVVGSAVWLRANVRSSFASLDQGAVDDGDGLVAHLGELVTDALPAALGLKTVYEQRWWAGPVGPALYVALLGLLAWACVRCWGRSRLLVGIAVMGPVILALNPAGVVTGEARYLLIVWPSWALLIMGAVMTSVRAAWAPVAVLAVGVVITLGGWSALHDDVHPRVAPGVPVPLDVAPAIAALESEALDAAYANYWIAHRLDFESDGRIGATPLDIVRFPDRRDAVTAATRAGLVVVAGAPDDDGWRDGFECLGVSATRIEADAFVVYVPARNVAPDELASACN